MISQVACVFQIAREIGRGVQVRKEKRDGGGAEALSRRKIGGHKAQCFLRVGECQWLPREAISGSPCESRSVFALSQQISSTGLDIEEAGIKLSAKRGSPVSATTQSDVMKKPDLKQGGVWSEVVLVPRPEGKGRGQTVTKVVSNLCLTAEEPYCPETRRGLVSSRSVVAFLTPPSQLPTKTQVVQRDPGRVDEDLKKDGIFCGNTSEAAFGCVEANGISTKRASRTESTQAGTDASDADVPRCLKRGREWVDASNEGLSGCRACRWRRQCRG